MAQNGGAHLLGREGVQARGDERLRVRLQLRQNRLAGARRLGFRRWRLGDFEAVEIARALAAQKAQQT